MIHSFCPRITESLGLHRCFCRHKQQFSSTFYPSLPAGRAGQHLGHVESHGLPAFPVVRLPRLCWRVVSASNAANNISQGHGMSVAHRISSPDLFRFAARAGSKMKRKFPSSGNEKRNTLFCNPEDIDMTASPRGTHRWGRYFLACEWQFA